MSTEERPGSDAGPPHPPPSPHQAHGAWAEIRDAISLRAFAFVTGTMLLGVGFVISYVGALHSPRLHALPVTIVAPDERTAQQIAGRLSQLPGDQIVPSPSTNRAAAAEQVAHRDTGAAFVLDPSGTRDTLIVASAAGAVQALALEKLFAAIDRTQGRTVAVDDVVPAGPGDFNGISTFYLVVGWCVTGYLVAAILGMTAGTRPSTLARARIRLLVLALYGFVAALIGTWLVQQHILGVLTGAFWPTVGAGTLLIFAVGALTAGLQIAFGPMGIALAVLLVVVLGNPSSGGPVPRSMLPPFWRAIGAFLPPGAGTDAVRSISYFGAADTTDPLLIIGGYALLGVLLTMLLCAFGLTRRRPEPGDGAPGTAPGNPPGDAAAGQPAS